MKRISWLALLLTVVMMLSVFAGCSSESPATTTELTSTSEPTDTSEPADTTESADTTENPIEEPAENIEIVDMTAHTYSFKAPQIAIDGYELPLVDEPTTISLFQQWSSSYVGSPMEMYIYQEMEARTGIIVEYQNVSATEQFQIMYASQDYADIIKGDDTYYAGGIDKAIEDEIYIDAADVSELTPMFNAWQFVDETYRKACKTDSGAMYFRSVQLGCEPAWCGGMVRSDWLADVGLDVPVTYNDWHEMLTAFKEQKGATKALALSPNGYETTCYTLTAGYDVAPGWYHVDGEIKYGFVEEGIREYVTMMNQWYSEGLVDPDFPGYVDPFASGQDMVNSGTTGAWDWAAAMHGDLWPALNNGEGTFVGVTSPVKNEGDAYHLRRRNDYSGGYILFISTAAEENGNLEAAAKWIDYNYTLDCGYLWTFGEYALDWEYNEEGVPAYTDHYYNNPEGKSIYAGMKMQSNGSHVYIWWREFDTTSESCMASYHTWQDSSDAAYNIPSGIALTTEEGENYASRYSDIQTYVQENIPLFIRGDRSLEEWDEFVAALYQLGLQDCIDIYQNAFDRYNAR